MKIRSRKFLLNLTSLGLLAAACGLIAIAVNFEPQDTEDQFSLAGTVNLSPTIKAAPKLNLVDNNGVQWQRKLRQPLYDPPPVEVVVIPEPPRPVTVTLTGTILEAGNSKAFIRTQNGSIQLKRLGDKVTEDPLDGTIESILANEIVIKREKDEIRLFVNGQN